METEEVGMALTASLAARRFRIVRGVGVFLVGLVTVSGAAPSEQTNASKTSSVGTWRLDIKQSDLGSDPAPKSLTLTILKDEPPTIGSWRVDITDAKGERFSYSWNGPLDGTLHPIKAADGRELGKESLKREAGGALLRHGEDPSDGSSFDGRATLSADGNTITDVVTTRTKEGKVTKTTSVFHRVRGAK